MRLLCLCNGTSGSRPERAQTLGALLPRQPHVHLEITQNAAHMAECVAGFDPGADDVVAVHGGDGTLQGLLSVLARREGEGLSSPSVAVLPGGSTNMSARDINRSHRWQSAAKALALAAQDVEQAPRKRRAVLRAMDPAGLQAGFFLGAGAVVEGIDYCNRRLWAQGAARREATAGLAMVRTIIGVLRAEAPFDASLPLSLEAHGPTQGDAPLSLAPDAGATLLAVSTLKRLLVGARPHWGAEAGALRFTLVERSAPLLRNLGGLLGLPLVKRPSPSCGFHSHNCARLELRVLGQGEATAAYTIDGEVFAAPTALTIDAQWSPRFLIL